MKKVADKQILMAADFAGYPLKEAIKEYLEKKGWTVTDIGVRPTPIRTTPNSCSTASGFASGR